MLNIQKYNTHKNPPGQEILFLRLRVLYQSQTEDQQLVGLWSNLFLEAQRGFPCPCWHWPSSRAV